MFLFCIVVFSNILYHSQS